MATSAVHARLPAFALPAFRRVRRRSPSSPASGGGRGSRSFERFARITSILSDVRRSCIAFVASILAACGSSPQPPVLNPPTTEETITGTERVGWDQPAADATELATIRYAIYVDDVRSEMAGVTCASTAAANGFACTGRLPTLTRGAHSLQIASFIVDSAVLESARSASLRVNVVAAAPTSSSGARTVTPGPVVTADGIHMRIEQVTDGLDLPSDLAFTPDGRLLIADATGRTRIVRDGRLLRAPAMALGRMLGAAGRLLAIAIDPQFARIHFVYVVYTAPRSSGDLTFTVARMRQAADTLGDVVPLAGNVPAAPSSSAALRFADDGKLYVALDAGGDARRIDDRGSWNGKLLRMNTDGTTPADQAGSTPVFAAGVMSPAGLAWHRDTKAWWAADRNDGKPVLRSIVQEPDSTSSGRRGVVRLAYALPADATPLALA